MADITINFDNLIDNIVFAFEMEMGTIETRRIKGEIARNTSPAAMDALNRQTRRGPFYDEERKVLRGVLRKFLGNDKQLKELIRPAAKKLKRVRVVQKFFHQKLFITFIALVIIAEALFVLAPRVIRQPLIK